MTKYAAAVLAASLLLGGSLGIASPAFADNCAQKVVCPVVPETHYHGQSDVHPTIKVTVCFTDREHRIITRPDGTNEWVVHLRYKRGTFERIATMQNAQCRDQFVTSGTRIAVYVTCPEYTGWVSTPAITKDGTYVMERVGGEEWSYSPV